MLFKWVQAEAQSLCFICVGGTSTRSPFKDGMFHSSAFSLAGSPHLLPDVVLMSSKLHATWSNRVDSLRVTMIRSPVLLAHGIFTLSFYPVKEKDLLLLLFWISGARKSLMPFTSPVQHNLVMLCIHPCIHPSRISSLWNISAYTVRGELEDNMNKRIISHL